MLYNKNHPFDPPGNHELPNIANKRTSLSESLKSIERHEKLVEMLCNKRGKKYDVLVPVRGDAEDYFVLNKLLSLGLTPLVLMVNNYFMNQLGWKNFHNLITYFDVDTHCYMPNFNTYRDFVSHSLVKILDPYYPYRSLRTSYAMYLAHEHKIPWVIWGMCQPCEFACKFEKFADLRMSKWWWETHELGENSIEDTLGTGAKFTYEDIAAYDYPSFENGFGPTGIFLSNYMDWDQRSQNLSALDYGFIPEKSPASVDWYENAGNLIYYTFKEVTRYEKYKHFKVWDLIERDFHKTVGLKESKIDWCLDAFSWKRDCKPFFFQFLDTTVSGYEWFMEKYISEYKNKNRDNTNRFDTQSFQDARTLENCENGGNEIVFFGKGIK